MGKDKVKHYTFQIRYFPSCFSYSFLSRCWPEYDWSVLKLDVTTKPINFQYCPIYWNTSERVARKGSTLCNDCSNQINFVPAWFKSSVTFFVWVLLKQGWNWGGESFLLLARRLTRHRHGFKRDCVILLTSCVVRCFENCEIRKPKLPRKRC